MDGLDRATPPVSSPDSKSRLAALVQQAVRTAFPDATDVALDLERPRNPDHGDFATNVAMRLAKAAGRNPRELAQAIVCALPVVFTSGTCFSFTSHFFKYLGDELPVEQNHGQRSYDRASNNCG